MALVVATTVSKTAEFPQFMRFEAYVSAVFVFSMVNTYLHLRRGLLWWFCFAIARFYDELDFDPLWLGANRHDLPGCTI